MLTRPGQPCSVFLSVGATGTGTDFVGVPVVDSAGRVPFGGGPLVPVSLNPLCVQGYSHPGAR